MGKCIKTAKGNKVVKGKKELRASSDALSDQQLKDISGGKRPDGAGGGNIVDMMSKR